MKRLFCILCIACAVAALAVSASAAVIPAGEYVFNSVLTSDISNVRYNIHDCIFYMNPLQPFYDGIHNVNYFEFYWKNGSRRFEIGALLDNSQYSPDIYSFTSHWYRTVYKIVFEVDNEVNSELATWWINNTQRINYLEPANINFSWELDNSAIIAIEPPENTDFIGYRLYRNNVPERYISADSLEVRIDSPGSYYITVIYPGEAPEDADRESDPSNVIEWNGQFPAVYLSISNNYITWSAPSTDKEVGEYTIYQNGNYVASVSDTAYYITSGAYGLYQVKVLYAEGGESVFSNSVRYGYFPAIETVHIGNGGYVSFVPIQGNYSGYVTGYTIYYSDDLESDRTNEIQITGNSFQLPNSCTFSIVTHYLYGDSVPSQVFTYQSDLVYDLLPGISSGIDGITGSMKQFIDGYEKPSRPSISAPVNEYDQFTDDIINDLDYDDYGIDQYSSTLERYTAGFNFWGEIFGLFIDIPVINDIVLIWASIAIFSLFFGSVIVGIIVYRPRKEPEHNRIGFTAPLPESYKSVKRNDRKAGFE